MQWLLGLPLQQAVAVGVGVALTYALIMTLKFFFDSASAKAAANPEAVLRQDLIAAHQEVRNESRELRTELEKTYHSIRALAQELHRIRENVAALRVELHHLRTEYPESDKVLAKIINRLDTIHLEREGEAL
jgi:septal ring factor EnvC (AmiA/AmiB activator)